MTTIKYAHIELAPDGTPYISGTKTKVEDIALDHLAYRWDADEIHRQHPHLSLGEIHSAMAYYYDHQAEMDALIEEGFRQVMAIKANLPPSPIQMKLKAKGLLP
jgi:uncharacterized protein (DUF433 family)